MSSEITLYIPNYEMRYYIKSVNSIDGTSIVLSNRYKASNWGLIDPYLASIGRNYDYNNIVTFLKGLSSPVVIYKGELTGVGLLV